MLSKTTRFIKSFLLFFWDPETVVGLNEEKPPSQLLTSPISLFLILAFLAFLYKTGFAHLTCWTPKFYSPERMYFSLGAFFCLTIIIDIIKSHRSIILLLGSVAISFVASPPMTLLAFAILIPYFIMVKLPIPSMVKHIGVILLHALFMAFFSFKLFPGIVFSSIWGIAGLMWAFFIPLRLFWFHFQLTRDKFKDNNFQDFFLYFFMVPAPFILPYMFALPRRNEMKAVSENNNFLKATGTLYILTGIAFYLTYNFLDYSFMHLSTINGMKFILIPWGYPIEPVFWAIGSSYIITGMYNRVGAKVTLAFRSPLNSGSVLEWWRRWNVHFRDMLVDIFFYPFVMGRRKHPYLRLWAGVFGVFIFGSTILHWFIKQYFMDNTLVPYWSMLVENSVMFLAVGILLHLEKYSLDKRMRLRKEARKAGKRLGPQPEKNIILRVLGYPLTYFIVFISVIGGYSTNLSVEGTYVDRPTAVYRYSRELFYKGNIKRADYYEKLAIDDFKSRIFKYDDLSSPWRIKERHGAYKLLRIYIKNNNFVGIKRLTKLLKLDNSLLSRDEKSNGYPKLKAKINSQLSRLKGVKGLKYILKGDI